MCSHVLYAILHLLPNIYVLHSYSFCVIFAGKLNNPLSTPRLEDVVHMLQPIQPRWYELFLHLGIQRGVLEELCAKHHFDDHSALVKAVVLWLQRADPSPSWRELVHVVEYYLLEGQTATEIKRKFCLEYGAESKGMCVCGVHIVL